MSVRTFHVNITPQEATDMIKDWVLKSSISGTLVDQYERKVGNYEIVVFVLEKYYMRTSNRASLTVTIDNLDGATKVHAVAAGSSESLIRFDWGAGKRFSKSVEDALQRHIMSEE